MNAKEIEIPVPWGIISAKTWGFDSDPLVLMLHGLEDNANSFDHLVTNLSQEYYYVSIDFPGHGKSTNLPSRGLPLQGMNYVYVVKMVVDYFGRDKNIVIGHSFGAILVMQYGFVYPEKLEKVFILDTLWFEIVEPQEFGKWVRNKFEEFTKISQQIQRNTNAEFNYEECFDLMSNWRYNNFSISPGSTKTLLKRSIKPCGRDKYKFTRDPKLKNYLCYPMDDRYACEILNSHNISFKVVIMITEFYESYYTAKSPNLVESYKKIGDWVPIKGGHHVHMDNPTVVSNVINRYLEECIPI